MHCIPAPWGLVLISLCFGAAAAMLLPVYFVTRYILWGDLCGIFFWLLLSRRSVSHMWDHWLLPSPAAPRGMLASQPNPTR